MSSPPLPSPPPPPHPYPTDLPKEGIWFISKAEKKENQMVFPWPRTLLKSLRLLLLLFSIPLYLCYFPFPLLAFIRENWCSYLVLGAVLWVLTFHLARKWHPSPPPSHDQRQLNKSNAWSTPPLGSFQMLQRRINLKLSGFRMSNEKSSE